MVSSFGEDLLHALLKIPDLLVPKARMRMRMVGEHTDPQEIKSKGHHPTEGFEIRSIPRHRLLVERNFWLTDHGDR